MIIPYGGDYHLACEVLLTSPTGTQTWSIFVDAESEQGEILGYPRNLTCHAFAYASSAEALAAVQGAAAAAAPGLNENWQQNPCAAFMDVGTFNPANENNPLMVAWPRNETTGPMFEASNVAIHARRLHDYFLELGADPARLHDPAHRLATVVGWPAGGNVDTAFNPTKRRISFQHQPGQAGIPIFLPDGNTLPLFHPARDPELIYHEVSHGLMWLLNPEPFEHQLDVAPFARSLVEGYANYFGRSFARRGQGVQPPDPWAAAAYRTQDWGDRWTLDRQTNTPGQDSLAVPDLYPEALATGLRVYDVGMVWARALWDMRQILGEGLWTPWRWLHSNTPAAGLPASKPWPRGSSTPPCSIPISM